MSIANEIKFWLFHCSMDVGSNQVVIDLTGDDVEDQME